MISEQEFPYASRSTGTSSLPTPNVDVVDDELLSENLEEISEETVMREMGSESSTSQEETNTVPLNDQTTKVDEHEKNARETDLEKESNEIPSQDNVDVHTLPTE